MKLARPDEKVKTVIVNFVISASQLRSELGAPEAMAVVRALIDPLRVMKDPEQFNNVYSGSRRFRKPPPVFDHPRPMRQAVNPPWRKPVVREDKINELL